MYIRERERVLLVKNCLIHLALVVVVVVFVASIARSRARQHSGVVVAAVVTGAVCFGARKITAEIARATPIITIIARDTIISPSELSGWMAQSSRISGQSASQPAS